MPDSADDEQLKEQIRDELIRVGLGGGLEIGGPFTPAQLLAILQQTPDGAGAQGVFARLTALLRPDDLE